MKLCEVQQLLMATLLCGEQWQEIEISTGCGADLMSDVLAFTKDGALLLTGLTNPQVVRTADVGGIAAVIFVRGKLPAPETTAMAKILEIPLLTTKFTLFEACGILFGKGLEPCPPVGKNLEA